MEKTEEKVVKKIAAAPKPVQNGKSLQKPETKKSFFNGFANICQMDHALLYEEHEEEAEGVGESPAVRRRPNEQQNHSD